MKINLAKSAGFCFGVKRALNIALKVAATKKNIEMLGDIVHNEDVVRQIRQAGIKKINRLKSGGRNKILLIRAHGAGQATIEKAAALGYAVIDASCPMVKEIHRIAQEMERNGYQIIIIGDKQHDEVRGITGQLKNKAIVIDNLEHIPLSRIKHVKKAAVLAQSTQNLEKVNKIVGALKPRIEELRFFNTICRPTRMKQGEIRTMPLTNDVMIVIGSKNSANTRRLYEISRSLNKKSYWIQSRKEIKKNWFKGAAQIGITSGSSTPDSTTQEVIRYIRKIAQ